MPHGAQSCGQAGTVTRRDRWTAAPSPLSSACFPSPRTPPLTWPAPVGVSSWLTTDCLPPLHQILLGWAVESVTVYQRTNSMKGYRDPTKGIQRAKAENRGVRREKKGQECPGWVSATPGEAPVLMLRPHLCTQRNRRPLSPDVGCADS